MDEMLEEIGKLVLVFLFIIAITTVITSSGWLAFIFIEDIKVALYVGSGISATVLGLLIWLYGLMDSEPNGIIRTLELNEIGRFGTSEYGPKPLTGE